MTRRAHELGKLLYRAASALACLPGNEAALTPSKFPIGKAVRKMPRRVFP
eukprot:COSAG04_NODE_30464_length_262_cov_0.957055_1_plen_49_part_01